MTGLFLKPNARREASMVKSGLIHPSFSHPDSTVGNGIAPFPPWMLAVEWLQGLRAVTAGREILPASKKRLIRSLGKPSEKVKPGTALARYSVRRPCYASLAMVRLPHIPVLGAPSRLSAFAPQTPAALRTALARYSVRRPCYASMAMVRLPHIPVLGAPSRLSAFAPQTPAALRTALARYSVRRPCYASMARARGLAARWALCYYPLL